MKTELFKYIDSVKDKPFEWGVHDCLKFTGNCIKVYTGKDYNSQFPCSGKLEALKFLESCGGLNAFLDSLFSRKPVKQAQIGDIVTIKTDQLSAGICLGQHSALVTNEGLTMVSTLKAVNAWGVN